MKVYPGDLCVDMNVTPNVFRLMHSFTGIFAVPYKVGPDFQSVGALYNTDSRTKTFSSNITEKH